MLLFSLLLSRSEFYKSFLLNSMHGEEIEPPTYWVYTSRSTAKLTVPVSFFHCESSY